LRSHIFFLSSLSLSLSLSPIFLSFYYFSISPSSSFFLFSIFPSPSFSLFLSTLLSPSLSLPLLTLLPFFSLNAQLILFQKESLKFWTEFGNQKAPLEISNLEILLSSNSKKRNPSALKCLSVS
jgi:hypothetical protein